MKKIVKTMTLGLSLIFALGVFAGCGNDAAKNSSSENTVKQSAIEQIKERGKVRIGVFSDKPPFGFVDANGQNQGYDVYFARRIAKDLLGDENKVEFVLVEAASRVEVLEANKVDITLANFTVTPERQEKVDFANPYMKVALGVVSSDGALITEVSQLKGKKLIVNKGTTAETYFAKNYPEIELLKYDQNTEAFQALKDGRGAALAHDNTLLFAWARENQGYTTGIAKLGSLDYIAPAVKKGNTELKDWLNGEITQLAAEEFFHKDYTETLLPAYGDSIKADDVVIEGGKTE